MRRATRELKRKTFFCFLALIWALEPVSGQDWDGVIVTAADFQALQAFKHELDDPRGVLRSWNDSGFGACSGGWAGIKCAQGQVIVIQLPWKGLGGRISEKIGQLQALRKLSLHDNDVEGPIPYSLGLLPNLRGLQLFNNRLSGLIPSSLGLSPFLQTLDLGNNSLTGSIPKALANSTRLLRVNASHNSLSGSIPESLLRSRSLTFLALDYNSLSGSISEEIGSLKNLSVLNLRGNRLTGQIPKSIGEISTLTFLDLSHNKLGKEIPDSVGELPNLRLFNVSYNNLSGSVPVSLAKKFNPSSFIGNAELCGFVGESESCTSTQIPSQGSEAPGPELSGSHRHRHRLSTKDAILIAAGSLLVVLLIICCVLLICLLRRRKRDSTTATARRDGGRAEKGIPAGGAEASGGGGEAGGKLVHFDGAVVFTADDLLCATAEIMGKSTFGTVYKATLEDGHQVAVKRLREKITKGQKEFETEVNVLGRIRHPNLLAMRAYYTGPKGEKLLVFDYMPRGSLSSFLHARGPNSPIDWATRMRIAQGTARGVLHLHSHENVVHGNLSSSNVLLDSQGAPRVADFGLSRLVTAAAASNVIAASAVLGYRAPELSKLKKGTFKSDVYSLGVVILELLTGKPPGDQAEGGTDLPQWVASIVKEEWTNEVFDVELMRDAPMIGDELLNTLKLALHCVDPSPSARPDLPQLLRQLEEIRSPDSLFPAAGDDDDFDDEDDDGTEIPSTSSQP